MPQITKGGKFVFGWSVISYNFEVVIPTQAFDEYNLKNSDKVIIISGSKKTGGFCVSTNALIEKSNINGLFTQFPQLHESKIEEGEFVKYKGRLYCWVHLNNSTIKLSEEILKRLDIQVGDKLLSIRGSDIAFVMGVKGPLIERTNQSEKAIDTF